MGRIFIRFVKRLCRKEYNQPLEGIELSTAGTGIDHDPSTLFHQIALT
jgi:hypothetical protein